MPKVQNAKCKTVVFASQMIRIYRGGYYPPFVSSRAKPRDLLACRSLPVPRSFDAPSGLAQDDRVGGRVIAKAVCRLGRSIFHPI